MYRRLRRSNLKRTNFCTIWYKDILQQNPDICRSSITMNILLLVHYANKKEIKSCLKYIMTHEIEKKATRVLEDFNYIQKALHIA